MSEKMSMMYVQTTLRNRKTVKPLLEKGTVAGAYYKKEEDVVNEIELTDSSTLAESRRTATKKLVKALKSL